MFIAVDGKATGPFGEAELARRLKSRANAATVYVWMEGMEDWALATEVPALRKVVARLDAVEGFDPFDYILGTWVTRGNVVGALTINSRLTLTKDLQFTEVNDVTESQPKRTEQGTFYSVYTGHQIITGTWTYYDTSRTRLLIHLKVEDSSKTGDADIPKAEDRTLEMVLQGPDTMRNVYGGVYHRQSY